MLLRFLCLYLILTILTTIAIEHDSLQCRENNNCETSHYILTLNEKDDEKAERIATEHHMVVKVINCII